MEPIVLVSIIGVAVFILMFVGASLKPVKWIGNGAIRLVLGAVALFLINLFGNLAGIHMPINLFTASIAGFLGIPGFSCFLPFIFSCFHSKNRSTNIFLKKILLDLLTV
ncbi:pro-sigmaK processing inhibitor BofA family protein [Geomicrobium sp. JCM 19055]|uniref:pro-sigmaK processing inhibitor BofA family protein n=1 Tax=Geomicrobium sp. JCM 19055 TaxID=1460649 RepID=UPI0009DEEFDF|nr:pro-sigmaK processing inhibitor BofA family protein [Geomicrobium sp. JCM 19055]